MESLVSDELHEELRNRIARWMAERGVEGFELRREGDVVKVFVDGKEIAEVEIKTIENSVVFRIYGSLADKRGQWAEELANKMEMGKAEPYQMRALLATDGWYYANAKIVEAMTTSVIQAVMYRRLGMEVVRKKYADLIKKSKNLKPVLKAYLTKEKGGAEVVEMVKNDLENAVRALEDRSRRMDLLLKALALLSRVEIKGENDEESRIIRRKIMERIEMFLTKLRLGENGAVCLVNCQLGEPTLTYKHEAYARVVAPLLHYIAEDASTEEAMKFLAHVIFYDGTVRRDQVVLTFGRFGAKKKLPLDMFDKIALYLLIASKYNVELKKIYVYTRKNATIIRFDLEYALRMLFKAWSDFFILWDFGRKFNIYGDHISKKVNNIRKNVEKYVKKKIKIEYKLEEKNGPKLIVYFKDDEGNEVVRINVEWFGENLHAKFIGSREKAEYLASILNALGLSVEAKKSNEGWYVELYTDSITAIHDPKWLEVIGSFIEKLYAYEIIDDKKKNELLKKIKIDSNNVKIAGVEMSVTIRNGRLEIRYWSLEDISHIVETLKAAGFEESVDFVVKKIGKKNRIYLKLPASLWRLEELRRQGIDWAAKAIERLEEIAKRRGVLDALEKYLKPAREAETIDPRMIVVENPKKIVIKDLKLKWKNGKPRIMIEYEINGKKKSFYLTWGIMIKRTVYANVKLDEERAIVLAALTNDESIKKKRGFMTLTAMRFFALVRYKGVGWDLLRWYARAII